MKTLFKTAKYFVPSLVLLFILSCKHPAEKNIGSPRKDVGIETKKEDSGSTKHAVNKEPEAKKEKSNAADKTVAAKWEANAAGSQIKFSVKGPFGTVNGNLSGLKATILFDKDNLAASSIRASTDAKSISTGIKLRNKDLQKEKYLDADKYPAISFQSSKIEKAGNGYKAIGELNIKGVSKPTEIPFTFSEKNNGGVFKGSFTVNREAYGVGKPGGSIGSNVSVNLTVPVTKGK